MASRVKKLQDEIEELRNLEVAPQEEENSTVETNSLIPDIESDEGTSNPVETTTTSRNVETETRSEDPRESDPAYWKHRFDVVQGKYNKEISELRELVAGLQEQLYSAPKSVQTAPTESVEDAIDNLADEYGAEFTDAMDKRIKRIAKQMMSEQFGEMEKDFSKIKATTIQSEQEKFEDKLSGKVEDWRSLNTNPDFIGWLGNTEPYSGLTLHNLLLMAYENKDIERVAKIFTDFKQLTKPNTKTEQAPSRTADHLIEPSKRGSVSESTATSNRGNVFTIAQIDQFYTDYRNGKFKGKDEWVEKMRADIQRASSEGRIVA
jgi:hypothetical protein